MSPMNPPITAPRVAADRPPDAHPVSPYGGSVTTVSTELSLDEEFEDGAAVAAEDSGVHDC